MKKMGIPAPCEDGMVNSPIQIGGLRANKSLYDKILNTLDSRCYKKRNKMVSLPDVFLCLSWMRISKRDGYIILYEMQKLGMVELKPYHGLILRQGGTL